MKSPSRSPQSIATQRLNGQRGHSPEAEAVAVDDRAGTGQDRRSDTAEPLRRLQPLQQVDVPRPGQASRPQIHRLRLLLHDPGSAGGRREPRQASRNQDRLAEGAPRGEGRCLHQCCRACANQPRVSEREGPGRDHLSHPCGADSGRHDEAVPSGVNDPMAGVHQGRVPRCRRLLRVRVRERRLRYGNRHRPTLGCHRPVRDADLHGRVRRPSRVQPVMTTQSC